MSETDSFVDEVSEEVRKDRLYGTFRKYAWVAVVAVLAIVGGAAANEYFKSQERAEAQATGDALLAALETEDGTARAEALAAIELSNPGQNVLARMTQAAVLVAEEKLEEAFDVLRAASEVPEADAAYTGLAALKAAMMNPQDDWSAAALERLSTPGGPYRLLALEQLGLSKASGGDTAGALADLTAVLQDPGVTPAMAQRIAQVVTALGGEVPSFAQMVGGNG